MNKRSFRLIFDRERGMLVAAGEHLASSGKASQGATRGSRRRVAVAAALAVAAAAQMAPPAAEAARTMGSQDGVRTTLNRSAAYGDRFTKTGASLLPQPMLPGGAFPFMQKGTVTLKDERGNAQDPTRGISNGLLKLLIDQGSESKIILNWSSFDIAPGKGVHFLQPTNGSALNYIRGQDPTLIMGALASSRVKLDDKGNAVLDKDGNLVLENNPTGEILLQNGNGLIFGPTARVNTGRFVATALGISQEVYERGYRSYRDGTAVFDAAFGDNNLNDGIVIERGAEIVSAAGGDVLIIAPRIVNEGRIETPDGQTVMAAGSQVFLVGSSDNTQRGLVVSVTAKAADGPLLYSVEQGESKEYKTVNGQTVADGTPDNVAGLVKKVNAIVAERGSINLVGLAIRQNGLLQATTAVKGKNGVIQLVAEQTADYMRTHPDAAADPTATRLLGEVVFGVNSRTEVLPSTSSETQLQAEATTYAGNVSKILVEGSRIDLKSGATLKAPSGLIKLFAAENAISQTQSNTGGNGNNSRIVVESGATIDVGGLKNVSVPMSTNQLSGRVFSVELADTPVQRNGVLYRQSLSFDARTGTSVANVSGLYNNVARTAADLATAGGKLELSAGGAVVLDQGATIDISGGSVQYEEGEITTSLVRYGNRWIPISEASPDLRYSELYTPTRGKRSAGYSEGRQGGSALFDAPVIYFGANLLAHAPRGTYQTGRGGSQVPKAGSVAFGNPSAGTLFKNAILLQREIAARPAAMLADPLSASVASMDPTLVLSTDSLNQSGLGVLTLYTDKSIDLAAGARLVLSNGGSFTAASFEEAMKLYGSIEVHGGDINIASKTGLLLAAGSVLDVSGTWADDKANPGSASVSAVDVDGGTITLSTLGDITTEAGSALDVSAGGWRAASGAETKGEAGSLSARLMWGVSSSNRIGKEEDERLATGVLRWNGDWRGFGFSNGGKLSISGLQDLTLDAAGPFSPSFFNDHGFGSFTLKTFGDVLVASSFNTTLQLKNYATVRSRPGTQRFAEVKTLEDSRQRGAVSLTLSGTREVTKDIAGSSLTVEQGARIQTEVGGTLDFSSQRNMTIAGSLIAPGGVIKLANGGDERGNARPNESESADQVGFLQDQALWLTPTAYLSVAGTAETGIDRFRRRIGDVFSGGSISLLANRGYVVAQAGSVMDLSGYADTLYSVRTARYELVSRSAGSLTLSTPEGFLLESALYAGAPHAAADGGSISASVTFSGGTQDFYTPIGKTAYPTDLREIRLLDETGNRSARLSGISTTGTARNLQAALGNGWGELSASSLMQAGFANVAVQADDKVTLNLRNPAGLSIAGRLSISSPVLAAVSGSANHLSAAYVALGNQRTRANGNQLNGQQYIAPQASVDAAGASLTVNAGLIEVYGLSALQGVSTASLNATRAADGSATRQNGEIRLIEVKNTTGSVGTLGGLRFAGDLNLTAGQVYATTLSGFTLDGCNGCGKVAALGNNPSHLTFNAPAGGSTSATPLSALGSLKAIAGTIDQNGVVRQPFGEIELQATKLNIGAGSLTSVSGDGLTVPVGATINNGQKWVYYANSEDFGKRNPLSESLDTLPVPKAVTLNGATLNVSSSATLDASAGGDLQAWEFIPGVGGSTDYLAQKGVYAVIPSYGYEYAPYDADVAARGGALQAGRQIEITMPGSALAPGRYTLLPARYALLPGAVVVSLAADQGSTVLRTALHKDDGSTIVTGSFASATGNARSDAGTRIMVETASTYLAKSQQLVSSISELLAAKAAALGSNRPNLPRDGGRVSLVSSNPFDFSKFAKIKLAGAKDALAGQLDLSVINGKFAIVDDPEATIAGYSPADKWILLSASQLTALDAGSLLIGGVRSGTDVLTVDVQASAVHLLAKGKDQGEGENPAPALAAGEVILVGKDVTLGEGSSMAANGNTEVGNRTLKLAGDSALAMVSNSTNTIVARTGASYQNGNLTVKDKAVLRGPAAYLNATGGFNLSAKADIQARTLGLASNRISIGEAPAASTGVVLKGDLLKSVLANAKSLQLTGLQGITFYGSQTLAAPEETPDGTQDSAASGEKPMLEELVLDAPTLVGLGQASDVVRLEAAQVTLRNTTNDGELNGSDGQAVTSSTMTAAMQGQSQLKIETQPGLSDTHVGGLDIGPGRMALGFQSASLGTTGDVTFHGTGMLVAQGAVTVSSARVTAGTAADNGIDARGLLRFEGHADAHTLGERTGLGAKLNFSGQHIEQAGNIEALAGQIKFLAQGAAGQKAVAFEAGSTTTVAGVSIAATDTYSVQADAGTIGITAAAGDVALDGKLDASGVGDGNAGTVQITAAAGELELGSGASLLATAASADALGGSLLIDVLRLALPGENAGDKDTKLDTLATALAKNGKASFTNELNLRVRSGDLALGKGASLTSRRVILAADAGSVTLGGSILADAASGGVVQLHAAKDLSLEETAVISARSTRKGANGGDVLLSTTGGKIQLADEARIDASGIETTISTTATGEVITDTTADPLDGRIVLRAPRIEKDGKVIDVAIEGGGFDANTMKAAEIDIAGIKLYSHTGDLEIKSGPAEDSSTTVLTHGKLTADNEDFMKLAGAILGKLNAQGNSRVHVRPDVEIVAAGNITISEDWDLNAVDHYDGTRSDKESGFLTVRAGGNLRVVGSISDGFDGTGRGDGQAPTAITQNNGWSYRLVAGADRSAADAMRTNASRLGNLNIASDKIVRTTSGSIELAAANDIKLEKAGTAATQAVVYVAGRNNAAIVDSGYYEQWELAGAHTYDGAWAPQFTSHGGRLELAAGNDIVGQPVGQLFGAWFYHTGQDDYAPVAWWSAFDAFRLGVGSFGGGDVRVVAGRDVKDLSIVSPTTALASGPDATTAALMLDNGGDIYAKAGRNILGGSYFLGRGAGWLLAGGMVEAVSATQAGPEVTPTLAPILGLMDGQWNVLAQGDINIGGMLNPTILPSAETRVSSQWDAGSYFTYSDASAVVLRNVTGDIVRQEAGYPKLQSLVAAGGAEALTGATSGKDFMKSFLLWAPPVLKMAALGGSINYDANTVMLPTATSQLELYAAKDLALGKRIVMLDVDPQQLPSTSNPMLYDTADPASAGPLGTVLSLHSGDATPDFPTVFLNDKTSPARRFQAIHAGDDTPVKIHAGGSINFNDQTLQIPKAAEITAGLDIVNMSGYIGEHTSESDVTVISAGRNFLGHLVPTTTAKTIYLLGPGQLQVSAGRQIDLQTAKGFDLSGNRYNPDLPATSASIRLQAGTDVTLDVDAFASNYLSLGTGDDAAVQARRDALVKAVREALGLAPLAGDELAGAYDAALAQFRMLSPATQAAFAKEQFALAFAARYLAPSQPYSNTWVTAALESGIVKLDVDAFVAGYLTLDTGDVAATQARRNALVKAVREALHLQPLPDGALPAGFTEALAQFRTLSPATQAAFAKSQLAPGQQSAAWATAALAVDGGAYLSDAARFGDPAFMKVFDKVRDKVMFAELDRVGYAASDISDKQVRAALYAQGFQALDLAGRGESFSSVGDINLTTSRITTNGGGIDMLAQGGRIDIGVPAITEDSAKPDYGVIAYGGGNINAMTYSDFQVASQKVFIAGSNLHNIVVWSSHGNIDNGRGSNTVVTIPAMVAVFNPVDGTYSFQLPPLTTGSGIGVLAANEDICKALGTCNIGLYAPNGEVLALDTLIRAPGRISLAAQVVKGADNIVGGSVSGASVAAPSVSIALPSQQPTDPAKQQDNLGNKPAGEKARNAQLTVELIGLGLDAPGAGPADECRNDETVEDCRKRQQGKTAP